MLLSTLRYQHYRTIARKPGSGLPPRLSPAVQQLIERAMREDDETMATQIQAILARYHIYVSLATIVRNRRELGWGSAYCQLIRNANKVKRLDFALVHLHDNFDDVIWSYETTVQLETHKRMCYRMDLALSILSRSMSGEGSVVEEQLLCVFLKRLGQLHYTVTFSKGHFSPFI